MTYQNLVKNWTKDWGKVTKIVDMMNKPGDAVAYAFSLNIKGLDLEKLGKYSEAIKCYDETIRFSLIMRMDYIVLGLGIVRAPLILIQIKLKLKILETLRICIFNYKEF